MPDITANAPDGTKHVFPDGTDPAVIDRVMKQYITGQSGAAPNTTTSFSATGEPIPIDVAQRHARASIRPGETVQSRYGDLQPGPPTGAKEALYDLAGGVRDVGKEILFPEGKTELDKWKDIGNKLITQPQMAETQKAQETSGLESAGHTLASYVPFLGPMAAQTGESLGRKDYGGAAIQGIATGLGARGVGELDEGLKGKVTEAGKAIQRHLAIDQGKVRVVNDMVRQPLAKLDAAVSNEIGRSVNQAIQADEMDMQAKGTKTGMVDVSKASAKARDVIGQTAKEVSNAGDTLITRGEAQPTMSLREAKSYTTDVGRSASVARRAGNMREAAALDALYDGLHDATKDRATDLRQGKIWQHYIDETRNYKNMQGGLLGELTDEPIHAKALNKLTDPARATEASEISQALKKYGIDPATFDKAKEIGMDLNRYSQETKANFMGKIKAIIKHPLLAGSAAAGASIVGASTGVPGMGFVLPLIVAGKVANMLDSTALKSLLSDIREQTPQSSEQVNPPLEGPMKGVVPPNVPRGTAPSYTGPERRTAENRAIGDAMIDQLYGELRKATTPEDKARVQRNITDLEEQRGSGNAESDIKGMLKEQFKFTDNAAKSILQSIRGKYQGLDEGLKMAIAEAVKRTKGGKPK